MYIWVIIIVRYVVFSKVDLLFMFGLVKSIVLGLIEDFLWVVLSFILLGIIIFLFLLELYGC